MPSIRGVEISLTTRPGDEPIPEYPHPDSSSAQVVRNGDPRQVSPSKLDGASSGSPSSHTSGIQKTNPTTSVYIPTIPGSAFTINYGLTQLPSPDTKYMFFKLFINGRRMLSWGLEPVLGKQSKVVRSIWAPGTQYGGMAGLEERNFVFLPGQENKSAAEDGGLIEIEVFRAKARKARAPDVEEYRAAKAYGIAAPSLGLLDKPQDACYFDYHLLDARDTPYATFKLHYRSMKSLQQLNLIPPSEPETGNHDVANRSLELNPQAEANESDEAVLGIGTKSQVTSTLADTSNHAASHYFLKSPPQSIPPPLPNKGVPQPNKADRETLQNSYLQRPLPELPTFEPATRSRRGSAASNAESIASVAPSLVSQIYDGSIDESQVEIGVAQVVHIASVSSVSLCKEEGEAEDENGGSNEQHSADYSVSDYETSPPSLSDKGSDLPLSPKSYLPTTGSSFEFDLNRFSSPEQRPLSLAVRDTSSPARPSGSFRNFSTPSPRRDSQDPSESPTVAVRARKVEWMSHSPSPARRQTSGSEQPALPGLWSPKPTPPGDGKRVNNMPKRLPAVWDIFDDDLDLTVERAYHNSVREINSPRPSNINSASGEEKEEKPSDFEEGPGGEDNGEPGNWI